MKAKDILTTIWNFMLFLFSWCIKNINRIISIIVKNIRILIRSKSSALVVILGPLLIVVLVGLAFNSSSIYDIKIGVYSDKYSDLSNSIIEQLNGKQYSIERAESREICIDKIKKSEYDMCLVFSADMAVDNNKLNKITFYVDYTRVNLVYAIMDDIASKLSKTTDKLSLELTQTLVNQLDSTKDELAKKISSISALGANNRNIYTKIVNLNSKIINVNLTYDGNMNVDNIITQLNQAKAVAAAQNKSTGELDVALARAGDLQTKINWAIYNIKTTKEDLQKNSEELVGIQAVLDSDMKSIDEIKLSVSRVTAGIESLNVTTAEAIATPIQTDVQPIITEQTFLSRLFPTFLVLILMFVCITLAVTLVLNEKDTNAYFRNFITPTRDFVFIIGTYLTCLLIVFVQIAIIIYVIRYFLSEMVVNSLVNCYLPLLLIASLFIFIGMIIGYLFNSQETAILASLFIISASLFFSNTILPLETVSSYLQWLVAINPFVLGEEILKKILIFGFSLADVKDLLWGLVEYVIIMVVAVYASLKIYKRGLGR